MKSYLRFQELNEIFWGMKNFSLIRLFFVFALLSSLSACTHRKATHYEQFPKTPATPYTEKVLDFYSTKSPYGEFSNFALFPVFVDNMWWPTSEHYYQAHKYSEESLRQWVREAPTPYEAALRGRDMSRAKIPDWEQRKDEFMEKAVQDKFTRYPELTELLLSTGDAQIFEHTVNDCYWGDCGDRSGKNNLGLLLMKIRSSLRKSSLQSAN